MLTEWGNIELLVRNNNISKMSIMERCGIAMKKDIFYYGKQSPIALVIDGSVLSGKVTNQHIILRIISISSYVYVDIAPQLLYGRIMQAAIREQDIII